MDMGLNQMRGALFLSRADWVKPRVDDSLWLMCAVTEDSLLLKWVLIFFQNEFLYLAQLPSPFNGPEIG